MSPQRTKTSEKSVISHLLPFKSSIFVQTTILCAFDNKKEGIRTKAKADQWKRSAASENHAFRRKRDVCGYFTGNAH